MVWLSVECDEGWEGSISDGRTGCFTIFPTSACHTCTIHTLSHTHMLTHTPSFLSPPALHTTSSLPPPLQHTHIHTQGDEPRAREALTDMRRTYGIDPDVISYTTVISACGRVRVSV